MLGALSHFWNEYKISDGLEKQKDTIDAFIASMIAKISEQNSGNKPVGRPLKLCIICSDKTNPKVLEMAGYIHSQVNKHTLNATVTNKSLPTPDNRGNRTGKDDYHDKIRKQLQNKTRDVTSTEAPELKHESDLTIAPRTPGKR